MIDKPIFEFTILGSRDWGIQMNVQTARTLGLYLCVGPGLPPGQEEASNQSTSFNFTGPPGTASAIYYALAFQLGKWGYNVEKLNEWIEVSPTHRQYYEQTMSQKQMLEGVIKTGLSSAASAVADYELIQHDVRKYKEALDYFKAKDEHSLKAMFIDQVDIHTGEGVSMRSIAPRWPTIIADFIKLDEKDIDIEVVKKRYSDVSRPEAVILVTKNKLYQGWKKTFLESAKQRYELLMGLSNARKKSIEEYRNWLRPHIARFKSIRLGMATEPGRSATMKAFADVTGMSTFANGIRLNAWRFFRPVEARKAAIEFKPGKKFVYEPYDDFMRQTYVLDADRGLAKEYPWLRDPRKYCRRCEKYHPAETVKCPKCGSVGLEDRFRADQIVDENIKKDWLARRRGLNPAELYYIFLDIGIDRYGTKLPVGELEDITFVVRTYVISQNVLLVKMLEIYCREKEFERYIDELLGVKLKEETVEEIVRREYPDMFGKTKQPGELEKWMTDMRKSFAGIAGIGKKLSLPSVPVERRMFMLFKPGIYETEFKERISMQYLSPSSVMFQSVIGFLKDKAGVG
jgi:hypothetical protein